jgi:hypothetical protein
MHGVLIEYSSPPDHALADLLGEVTAHDERLSGKTLEHRLHSWMALTFGDCDLLVARWFTSYFPFSAPPPSPTASSRRITGVFQPDRRTLARWTPNKQLNALCASEPVESPFLAAIYVELSVAAMLSLTPRDLKQPGPVRQFLGLVASEGAFWKHAVRFAGSPDQLRGLAITPLMGLDRVPAVILVEADTLNQIAAVVAAIRQLRICDIQPHPNRYISPLLRSLSADTWQNEALVSDTATVVGLRLMHSPEQRTDRPAVCAHPQSGHWHLVGEGSRPGLLGGEFRASLRLPAAQQRDTLKDLCLSLSQNNGLMAVPSRSVCLGPADAWLDIRSQQQDTFSLAHIQGLLLTLHHLPPSSAGQTVLLVSHSTTLPLVHLPSTGIDVIHWTSGAFSEKMQQQFLRLRKLHLSREAPPPQTDLLLQSWLYRWFEAVKRGQFSYALTAAGIQLIQDTLSILSEDMLTFIELVPPIRRFLAWAESASGAPPQTDPPSESGILPHQLALYYQQVERLVHTRNQRGSPILRSPRSAVTHDFLAAYDITRLAFSAVAHAIAARLGLADVMLLDTVVGHMSTESLRDGGVIVEIPATQYRSPTLWVIMAHELAHTYLARLSTSVLPQSAMSAWRDAWASLDPDKPPSANATMAHLRHRALSTFTPRRPTEERFMRGVLNVMEEVMADLIAAAMTTKPGEDPRSRGAVTRFFTSWGPGMVHASHSAYGRNRPGRKKSVTLILRTFFFTRLLEAPPPLDWVSELGELAGMLMLESPLSGQLPKDIAPPTSRVHSHLRALRDDIWGRPVAHLHWKTALVDIARYCSQYRTGNLPEHIVGFHRLVAAWMRLADTLLQHSPAPRTIPSIGEVVWEKKHGVDGDAEQQTRDEWIRDVLGTLGNYTEKVIRLCDDLASSSPAHRSPLPWLAIDAETHHIGPMPWLPSDFPDRYPANDPRHGNTRQPRFSSKGGHRAGSADRGEPQEFTARYHWRSTQLLTRLARLERVRRLSILHDMLKHLREED